MGINNEKIIFIISELRNIKHTIRKHLSISLEVLYDTEHYKKKHQLEHYESIHILVRSKYEKVTKIYSKRLL